MNRGATYFELLVVLGILLVMVAIALFAYPALAIKAKLARVTEEQQLLHRVLEHYRVDFNDYPENQLGLWALTAPLSYVASVPRDPFTGDKQTYYYEAAPCRGVNYIVVSAGPDGDNDFTQFQRQVEPMLAATASQGEEQEQLRQQLFQYYLSCKVYDPTNGTRSDGDIVVVAY